MIDIATGIAGGALGIWTGMLILRIGDRVWAWAKRNWRDGICLAEFPWFWAIGSVLAVVNVLFLVAAR